VCSRRLALWRKDGNLAKTAIMSEWCVGWLNTWKTNLASHTDWLFAFWNKIVCLCLCVCNVCVCTCAQNTCCPFWQRIRFRWKWLLLDSLSGQCTNQIFYPRLLLGMNLGVFVYDPETKHHSFRWYAKISLGKKNFWFIESDRRPSWVLFSTAWVWCTTNLSL